MHPFFMARGPKIKKNHKVQPFGTVDLFNLFCEILEIASTKNNGTSDKITDILVTQSGKYSLTTILTITGTFIIFMFLSVGWSYYQIYF
jgi:hypothetical protein